MCRRGKSMVMILALAAAVMLGGLCQAFASEVLFNFGPPTQNINGYPHDNDNNPNRSNGANTPLSYGLDHGNNYQIPGDNFSIGTTGQQYHIDQITIYMLFGAADSGTSTSESLPGNPATIGVPLHLMVGTSGDISNVSSNYTATRVYYSDTYNYQRMQDGAWRQIWKINFSTNLTVQGGQEYYFFLDALLGNPQSGPLNTVSLVGANKELGNVTDIMGPYDNQFYWYGKSSGNISPEEIGFYSSDPLQLNGDFHVTITGSQVPIPGAVWLLGTGLFGLGALGRRRGKA